MFGSKQTVQFGSPSVGTAGIVPVNDGQIESHSAWNAAPSGVSGTQLPSNRTSMCWAAGSVSADTQTCGLRSGQAEFPRLVGPWGLG